MQYPAIINGGVYQDERGTLCFVNDFDLTPIKRFYTIFHSDTSVVRAWQGHKVEHKWFYILEGAFEIAIVEPDNWEKPSAQLPVQLFRLTSANNQVLHVPNGFATGFKALVAGSRMIVYSNLGLEESNNDNFRFDKQLWHVWE